MKSRESGSRRFQKRKTHFRGGKMCLSGKTNLFKVQIAPNPKTGKMGVWVKDQLRDGATPENSEYHEVKSLSGLVLMLQKLVNANIKDKNGDAEVLKVFKNLKKTSK